MLGNHFLQAFLYDLIFGRFKIKDMDLDFSHFFNLEQLKSGRFTETSYQLFKVEKLAYIEVFILKTSNPPLTVSAWLSP